MHLYCAEGGSEDLGGSDQLLPVDRIVGGEQTLGRPTQRSLEPPTADRSSLDKSPLEILISFSNKNTLLNNSRNLLGPN